MSENKPKYIVTKKEARKTMTAVESKSNNQPTCADCETSRNHNEGVIDRIVSQLRDAGYSGTLSEMVEEYTPSSKLVCDKQGEPAPHCFHTVPNGFPETNSVIEICCFCGYKRKKHGEFYPVPSRKPYTTMWKD